MVPEEVIFRIDRITPTSTRVTIEPLDVGVTLYIVSLRIGEEGGRQVYVEFDFDDRQFLVSELEPGTQYFVLAQIILEGIFDPIESSALFRTLGPTPVAVTFTAVPIVPRPVSVTFTAVPAVPRPVRRYLHRYPLLPSCPSRVPSNTGSSNRVRGVRGNTGASHCTRRVHSSGSTPQGGGDQLHRRLRGTNGHLSYGSLPLPTRPTSSGT